jgi:type II secretory pathway pseudopilin PulG
VTLALAIIGTLIALVGISFTYLERRDRKRAVTAEREDRDEQVGLLQRQVEAVERQAQLDEAAHDAANAADVVVRNGSRSGLGWSFTLVNAGRATAYDVKAWLVNAETGDETSVTLELGGPLLPGELTRHRHLNIPLPADFITQHPPLALTVSWRDTQQRERRDPYHVDL